MKAFVACIILLITAGGAFGQCGPNCDCGCTETGICGCSGRPTPSMGVVQHASDALKSMAVLFGSAQTYHYPQGSWTWNGRKWVWRWAVPRVIEYRDPPSVRRRIFRPAACAG